MCGVWFKGHLGKFVGNDEPLSDGDGFPGGQGFKQHLLFHLERREDIERDQDQGQDVQHIERSNAGVYNTFKCILQDMMESHRAEGCSESDLKG